MAERALLALADGSLFEGLPFGARGTTVGEVVFNTSLTGYQEVLTDPSYHGQIVAMTYPHQGNYGVNDLDAEAPRPWVRGFVVREATPQPSSWRAEEALEAYLARHGIVGIRGVDTRRLTRRLRSEGAMPGAITTEDADPRELVERARAAGIVGVDLVRDVTPPQPYDADPEALLASGGLSPLEGTPGAAGGGTIRAGWGPKPRGGVPRAAGARVAAIDCGMKRNILRCLVARGFVVRVFPASATAADILSWGADGVFVSNGPGDPAAVPYTVETIRGLLGAGIPTFGICLGHQLLGLALGGETYKLRFGHRGANHPVKNLLTGRVEITTQNHGFAVATGLDPAARGEPWRVVAASQASDWVWRTAFGDVQLTHFDLNDGTMEGMRCLEVPASAVQYHPEAAPGPHDARYLFDDFAELIAGRTQRCT